MKDIIKLILIVQLGLQLSDAQFPSVCMNPGNLTQSECCPVFGSRGKCGVQDGRGKCRNIVSSIDVDMPSMRDGWPYCFERVCNCTGNYAGYDCGRCKYGYHGDDCSNFTIMERRPISEFSPEDWKKYVDILAASKIYNSNYSVILNESEQRPCDITRMQPTPINLYDLFVWQHHYSAKDNENKTGMDYAHESTGFPTWHRQFLLWFEWEIQYMLQSMEHDDYYTFRIPYWDWRKEMQTDTNSPFQLQRLGKTINIDGLPMVQGSRDFPSSWETICWDKNKNKTYPKPICNPQLQTGPLQRCPLAGESCNSRNPLWPSDKEVQKVLSVKSYDTSPYSEKSHNSFRNQLEGFKPLSNDSIQSCRDDKLCLCAVGDVKCTESKNGTQPRDPIKRLLHNSIHIILGIGYFGSDASNNANTSGVMADVAASANDPIFLNHHAMVDCIFETWLQKNPNAQYPESNKIPKGHQKHDYMVPFFPLYKHSDMFSTADKFGYQCIIKSHQSRNSLSAKDKLAMKIAIPTGSAIVLAIIITLFIVCCYGCKKKSKNAQQTKGPEQTHLCDDAANEETSQHSDEGAITTNRETSSSDDDMATTTN